MANLDFLPLSLLFATLPGIVSNGLACLILIIFGILGKWQDWGILARAFMWGSAIATGLITTGLIVFMPKGTKGAEGV